MMGVVRSRHFVSDLDYYLNFQVRRMAGCAFLVGKSDVFHLKLNVFEPQTFFVVKNKSHPTGPEYWVLSRLWVPKHNKEPLHFQVGEGIKDLLRNTLVIFMFDLNKHYEINLEAEDFHLKSSADYKIKGSF